MTKSLSSFLAEIQKINNRVTTQAADIEALQATAAIQMTRIAQLQAELDVLPAAVERRKEVRASFAEPAMPSGNGNGKSHR
jgi:uncharacterized coiled-coil protein SlyX